MLRRRGYIIEKVGSISYAHQYVSPRTRRLSGKEAHVRDVSYSIKKVTSTDFSKAAKDMSKFVSSQDVLIPIPTSKGDVSANLKLAKAIARISGSKVVVAVGVQKKRESNRELGVAGKKRLRAKDMGMTLLRGVRENRAVFIDNVSSSGATLKAAMRLINGGRGLVYAKE